MKNFVLAKDGRIALLCPDGSSVVMEAIVTGWSVTSLHDNTEVSGLDGDRVFVRNAAGIKGTIDFCSTGSIVNVNETEALAIMGEVNTPAIQKVETAIRKAISRKVDLG